MLRLAATLLTLATAPLGSAVRRAAAGDAERGSVTLEQVLISLGLFLLAVAVVAGLTAVVNNRLAQIN
jgi:hypothetical protein